MLALLHRFSALVLILSILHTLLPEGSLRRTAMMSLGLIAALCFLEALPDTLHLPEIASPTTVLTATSVEAGSEEVIQAVYDRQQERTRYEQ